MAESIEIDDIKDCSKFVRDLTNKCMKNYGKENESWCKQILELHETSTTMKKDLDKASSQLKEEIEEIDRKSVTVNNILYKTREENEKMNKEIEKLKENIARLESNLDSKRKETEDIKRKGEPSRKDKQMLEMAKKKLSLLKSITRVTFDLNPNSGYIQGYIKKRDNSGFKIFKYKGNMTPEETREKLWNDISKIIEEEDSNKENIATS